MGKKRGGKNRFKKSNSDATEAGDSEVNEGDFRVVADYLKGIQPELERLLCSTSIAREDKAVKVDDDVALERRLLLTQFMHTIKGCEAAIFRHQKGSKIFEKFLFFLGDFLASGLSQKSDVEQSESSNDEEDVLTFSTCVRYVKKLLTVYMGCAVENATHLYASHAGQALLACFPAAIQYEQQRFEVSGAKPADSGLLARETLACFLGFLRDANGLHLLLVHSSGSHVLRTALLALHGYAATKTSRLSDVKHSSCQPSKFALAQNNTLPIMRRSFVPPSECLDIFQSFCSTLIDGIASSPCLYAVDPYASPLLQLILDLCQTQSERFQAVTQKLVSLFLPSSASEVPTLVDTLDELLTSPAGSRFLERLLTEASEQQIYVFVWYYLKKNGTLMKMALSLFGNYVIQRLISLPTFKGPELRCLIDELDFTSIIDAKRHGIIWRLADGCRRLRCHYKLVFAKHLEALHATSSSHFPVLWYCLIATRTPNDLQQLSKEETAHEEDETAAKDTALPTKKPGLVFVPDPIGCSLLSSYLKFPVSEIQPLLQSAKLFAHQDRRPWLYSLATSRQGSWCLQSVFDPYSPLDVKLRSRLARTLLPNMVDLAFHPSGSFVVVSAFKGSSLEVQRQIVESLKERAEELRLANFALYKALNMKVFITNQSMWNATTDKKSKILELFEDILAPSKTAAQRSAKTGMEAKKKNCFPSPPGTVVSQDSDSRVKKRKKTGIAHPKRSRLRAANV